MMTGLNDIRKFRLLAILTTVLTILILSYNILQKYFMPEIEGYLERRIYYEKAISKKGL